MNNIGSVCVAALVAVAGTEIASAQWGPAYQFSSIQRTGLFGAGNVGTTGLQFSAADFPIMAGVVAGRSTRYTGVATENGQNTWVYNRARNVTIRTGLVGSGFSASGGLQFSVNDYQAPSGHVVGYSNRYLGIANGYNGQGTWIYNPNTHTTVRTGLLGAEYTGSSGFQYSENGRPNASGQFTGTSRRISGFNSNNGQNPWFYDPAVNTSVPIGLTGAEYTGTSGYQFGAVIAMNNAGAVLGYAARITGERTDNGTDAWVYTPSTNTTSLVGLTGTGYSRSDGYRWSDARFLSSSGQIAGYTLRHTDADVRNGYDAWVYRPATGTSTRIGLTGAEFTGSGDYRYSAPTHQSDSGFVAGVSERFIGNPTASNRSTWVYNPNTGTTVRTGLTGPIYTSATGEQFGVNDLQNASGQVAGTSWHLGTGGGGGTTWVYSPALNATIATGLTDPAFVASNGSRRSRNLFQSASGHVAGEQEQLSTRGWATWVYNPVTNTTVRTGFAGGVYADSRGYEYSEFGTQIASGQIVGRSQRFGAVSGPDSLDGSTWVYNPITNATVQTGLTGPLYTGTTGYQVSFGGAHSPEGFVAGVSQRITGISTVNGQDAWYYDPATSLSTAIIGSVRTIDNYAFSRPSFFIEGGILLGTYTFFAGGVGSGEERTFLFRPDLGFTDLNDLLAGGPSASGWRTLRGAASADALRTIVGYGFVNGQTSGQSVFVLVPAPGTAAAMSIGLLLAARRRRATALRPSA